MKDSVDNEVQPVTSHPFFSRNGDGKLSLLQLLHCIFCFVAHIIGFSEKKNIIMTWPFKSWPFKSCSFLSFRKICCAPYSWSHTHWQNYDKKGRSATVRCIHIIWYMCNLKEGGPCWLISSGGRAGLGSSGLPHPNRSHFLPHSKEHIWVHSIAFLIGLDSPFTGHPL